MILIVFSKFSLCCIYTHKIYSDSKFSTCVFVIRYEDEEAVVEFSSSLIEESMMKTNKQAHLG